MDPNSSQNPILGNILHDIQFEKDGPARIVLATIPPVNIARVCLKKGQIIKPHMDSHAVFFLVVTGQGIFTGGTNKVTRSTNEYVYVKENDARGIEAIDDLVVLVIRA